MSMDLKKKNIPVCHQNAEEKPSDESPAGGCLDLPGTCMGCSKIGKVGADGSIS